MTFFEHMISKCDAVFMFNKDISVGHKNKWGVDNCMSVIAFIAKKNIKNPIYLDRVFSYNR
ncbi:hypothetical protein SF1_15930 [Sphingobacterium faecium NBRC 15299]|nr:hypothetical protein SF1_15930 [Sphingobacterium faecium NBRC 15299]